MLSLSENMSFLKIIKNFFWQFYRANFIPSWTLSFVKIDSVTLRYPDQHDTELINEYCKDVYICNFTILID